MIIPFRNPAAVGIIKDIPAHRLPIDAWSDGSNVRFRDGVVEKFTGYTQIYDATDPTSEAAAHYLMPYPQAADYVWVLAGLDDVWTYANSGAYTERTPVAGDFTGDADDLWSGGVLSGIAIVNNGVESPHKLDLPGGDTKLTVLKWDATHDWNDVAGGGEVYTCKVFRTYKFYGIALDIDEDGTRYPFRVRWSHPTDSGQEPDSWDETDDTKDAGFVDLDETGDYLVDCLPLGDENIIYKETTTWIQRAVGAGQVMAHRRLFGESGMMAPNCVREVNRLHVVKTMDDLFAHDGQRVTHRIVDRKWQQWLQNNIDGANFRRSFMVAKYRQNQIWFCFPQSGAEYANMALIWDYSDDTLSVRELPGSPHMALGVLEPGIDDTFQGLAGTLVSDLSGIYDIRYYSPNQQELLMSEYNASEMRLHLVDSGNTANGATMTAYIERTGIPLSILSRKGEPVVDATRFIRILRVIPYIEGTSGGVVKVQVGYQDNLDDAVTWETAQNYTIGTTRWLDFRTTGRYMAVKFLSDSDIQWTLTGYDIDAEAVSER